MFATEPANSMSSAGRVVQFKKVPSSKMLGTAIACTRIPCGAKTKPIDPKTVCGQVDVAKILVKSNEFRVLKIDDPETWSKKVHWIRALKIADDCHSYNVQLKIQRANRKDTGSKLILEAIRPIEIGQELSLWFSEDLLATMQMVFLTPANIQGQNKYVCTRCSAYYESPNPLKLHIMLNCGRLSVSDLWNKLTGILVDNRPFRKDCTNSEFVFKLEPSLTPTHGNNSVIDLSVSPQREIHLKRPTSQPQMIHHTSPSGIDEFPTIYRPYSEPPVFRNSAFKPFQKNPVDIADQLDLMGNSRTHIWPNLVLNSNLYEPSHSLISRDAIASDEAHIETLVSNLGKSKDGHVCLYCGKCYSRKYGLKIHIRTHTGYKPLKCKYCFRPFGDPSNLNKHVRLHAEGETPYKCELCGKVLVRRRDLERHLKSRHMSEINPGRNMIEDSHTSEGEDVGEIV